MSTGPKTLAIDIGGTGLKAGVLDADGKLVVPHARVDTPKKGTPTAVLQALLDLIQPLGAFDRVSVGFPGVVRAGQVLTAPNLGNAAWRDYPLAGVLTGRLGKPVRMLNDATVHGLGVIQRQGLECVITLGTGFGFALFDDGRLTPHLELAHHPIHDDKDYDQYVGDAAMKSLGRKRWNKRVNRALTCVRNLTGYETLYRRRQRAQHQVGPRQNIRIVANDAGITGGVRLWDQVDSIRLSRPLGQEAMSQSDDPDADARNALRLIGPDPANWVPDRPGIDHNVAIVGGGQTGCALAFALRRAGVGKVTVLEAAPDERHAGIWLNAARMNLLRTPKSLPGPELGIPALNFQAWYEARNGREAYAAIDRIPRLDWAQYLSWYKHFLNINPRYGTQLTRIELVGDHFRLHLLTPDGASTETTRKIILATGFAGGGGRFIPGCPARKFRRRCYAHTEDAIDFSALRGKTVGVIGAAASAFDAAGVALETGAAAVHLFARRDTIAAVPITRSRGFPGAYDNFFQLPDADRWHQAIRYRRAGSTPTTDAIERAVKYPNFRLHLSSPWTNATANGGVETTINGTTYHFDFVIAGTGYSADIATRPELRDFAGRIARWRDRYTPIPDEQDEMLACHPYLGAGHEFLETTEDSAPLLKHIHVQNPSGFVSFGLPIGDVPSMKRDIPCIVGRISADLFGADLDTLRIRMTGDVPPDFTDTLWRSAVR